MEGIRHVKYGILLCATMLLAACSDAGGDVFEGADASPEALEGTDAALPSPGSDSGGVLDAGAQAPTPSASNCASGTDFVYVIDTENRLYRFDPTVNNPSAFSLIGLMGCSGGEGPNSMSVGRDGFAYVLYGTHDFFGTYTCHSVQRVDINTGACAGGTPFQCGSAGFQKFGMGFTSDSPGSQDDSLFLSNNDPPGLGRVDMVTGAVAAVGGLPGAGEFTGNSKGELWGFFPGTPPAVHQIDKQTGGVLTSYSLDALPTAAYGSVGWAFATWGGSFYIFYYVSGVDDSTSVWKLDPDGTLVKYIPNVGSVIVGAGVSTCAPVTPPK